MASASGARGSNQTRIAFFPLGSLGAAGSHDADGPGLSRWAPLSLEALWAPFARLALRSGGTFDYMVDFGAYGADIAVLGTANFQCWYRDPSGGGAAFNLSDAIEIVFTP